MARLTDPLPWPAVAALSLGLSIDPATRVISESAIVASLAATTRPVADAAPSSTAEPERRVLTPIPAAGRGEPGLPDPIATVASEPAEIRPRTDDLTLAAQQVWGFVDLRAVTQQRLALQLQASDPEPDLDDAAGERPIWRHPAMIVSLCVAALLIAIALVLLLL
jgi:hypothetical protein